MDLPERVRVRFFSYVDIPEYPHAQCWKWTLTPDSYGYGRIKICGKLYKAHRICYELLIGPIPEGMELDHTCCIRNCVNPYHLNPCSPMENKRLMHERIKNAKAIVKRNHIVQRVRA